MPELPEIETIRRGLERDTVGRRVKSIEVPVAKAVHRNGSRKAFQAQLEGTKIKGVDRRGLLLVFTLDNSQLLVVDVGATGYLRRATAKDEVPKDTQVIITFTQGGQLRMGDPEGVAEAFVVTPDLLPEEVPELAELGLDPVAAPVSWTAFAQALVSRRTEKLKPLLLDPTFVVGLGNLYADEILHEATKHHGTALPDHPFTDLQGKEGSFQEELQVWGRDGEPCRRCRQTVTKQRSGGRTTWWCPSCQV